MGRKLVLGASRVGPQKRIGRPSDWTDAMADRFVEELADTCNVTLAAKKIRRSIGNIYKQRANNATFRAAWDQALATGYARLEMMMLERALHGVEKTVVARDGTSTTMRHYSDRVALTLLRMHRENVAMADNGTDQSEEYRAACERIVARLERLKEREADRGPDALETKAARPGSEFATTAGGAAEYRAGLIAWGLRRARR